MKTTQFIDRELHEISFWLVAVLVREVCFHVVVHVVKCFFTLTHHFFFFFDAIQTDPQLTLDIWSS